MSREQKCEEKLEVQMEAAMPYKKKNTCLSRV